MICLVDGRDVDSGTPLRVRVPRIGAWHVEGTVFGDVALTGSVTVSIDGVEWFATVTDSHAANGSTNFKLVGGHGGLTKTIAARHYYEPNPSTVIRSILNEAGEVLSSMSTIPVTKLPHWLSAKGLASHALTAICDKAKLVWRVLPNGEVWVGTETWPVVEPDVELLDEDWSDGSIIVAADSFASLGTIRPGTTFAGQKIEQVTHVASGVSFRTIPQISSIDAAAGEFLAGIRRQIEPAFSYPCKVEAQNADGTLQLSPEDERMAGSGLDNVPIRYGLPGWEAKVTTGAIVRLHFDNGDRSRPYATIWDGGHDSAVTSLEFKPSGRGAPVCCVGDQIEASCPMGMPISGMMGGVPFSGIVTITVPLQCVITGPGNPKLLA